MLKYRSFTGETSETLVSSRKIPPRIAARSYYGYKNPSIVTSSFECAEVKNAHSSFTGELPLPPQV